MRKVGAMEEAVVEVEQVKVAVDTWVLGVEEVAMAAVVATAMVATKAVVVGAKAAVVTVRVHALVR